MSGALYLGGVMTGTPLNFSFNFNDLSSFAMLLKQ